MDKKANFYMHWPEWAAIGFLVIGFLISISVRSAFLSYVSVLLGGMVFGRVWYEVDSHDRFPWIMMFVGFLAGFVLGEYYASKRVLILLFVIGIMLSYWLHKEGYIKTVQY